MPRQAPRRDLAAVHTDQPGDLNEGIEGNAQRQTGRLEIPFRVEEQSQVLGQKPGVFEPEQGQQVERQGQGQQALAGQAQRSFFQVFRRGQGQAESVVHAHHDGQQQKKARAPETVEDRRKEQQHQGQPRGAEAPGQPPGQQQKRQKAEQKGIGIEQHARLPAQRPDSATPTVTTDCPFSHDNLAR